MLLSGQESGVSFGVNHVSEISKPDAPDMLINSMKL